MSVAATKTFTAQVTLLYLLALTSPGAKHAAPEEIKTLLDEGLGAAREDRRVPRRRPSDRGDRPAPLPGPFFLYLGRHIGLPLCLKGASS
jgi:glucosamine--fructose-6-phosphate aminotransferase (isomerizing)